MMMNVYFAPHLTGMRCYQMGRAVREVIDEYPDDIRVGVVASGGLWHTPGQKGAWLNTEFDRRILELLEKGDAKGMAEHALAFSHQHQVVVRSTGTGAGDIGPLTSDLHLRAASGRRSSRELLVTVTTPPFLADLSLTARFPAYLGRPEEPLLTGPDTVPLPAGTTIVARGTASARLAAAAWSGAGSRRVALDVRGDRFEGRLVPAASGTWRLDLATVAGPIEGPPAELTVRLVPDSAPIVQLPVPGRDAVLPISLRQPLVIDARDDHGLARMVLVTRRMSRTGARGDEGRTELDVSGAGDRAVLQTELDVRDRVVCCGERGLLSIAFHPDFDANGELYLSYTGSGGASRLSRVLVADPANGLPDPATEEILLTVAQPFSNHNGGLIKFGPDGYLYLGLGDGGSGGDPLNHGQNKNTLLGALLRLDVDVPAGYGIPADNPFVGADGRDEIWAYGLRNPWRWSFDRETGDLWIADVGQNSIEEIDFQPTGSRGGENYGWRVMEGTQCLGRGSCPTSTPGCGSTATERCAKRRRCCARPCARSHWRRSARSSSTTTSCSSPRARPAPRPRERAGRSWCARASSRRSG